MNRARSQSTRWKFYDPALLYLFPITYLLHVLEEWFAAAPIAVWAVPASAPVAAQFVVSNAIGLLLMMIGIRLVRVGARFHWIVPAMAMSVLLNTAGHLVGSFFTRRYSAGLITAMILWVPLGLLTLARAWDQASGHTLGAGVIVAIAVESIVVLVLLAV